MTPYDPDKQFTLFDHTGKVIASGSMSALSERILDSKTRSDAIDLLHDAAQAVGLLERQQEEAEELRARQIHAFCDGVARLARRMDELEERHEAQIKADEEAEEERIRKEMDSWPDPDDPDPFGGPATYDPSGELHTLAPSDPSPGTADQGGLPRELEKEAPSPGGALRPPEEMTYPPTPQYRSPAAVSLMSEDDY
jgi:hypothetical protein